MAFSPLFLLASVFRRVVGRRQRIHPIPQDRSGEVRPHVHHEKCGLESFGRSKNTTTTESDPTVCESEDLRDSEESQLGGNNESVISKKHGITLESETKTTNTTADTEKTKCLNGHETAMSLEQRMEILWSKKSPIETEFFAHEYGPEDGGRTDTWKGLYRQLENMMVFNDPGLELFINPDCHIHNRYRTVLPYVKNRVNLSEGDSDYINASYVTVEQVERSYIVTQGPLENTIPHFWEMVWEHKSIGIVMLCRCEEKGSEKCAQYWPTEGSGCVITGFLMVECRGCTWRDSYCVSSLEIQNLETEETHTLLHFHYHAWPDFGVPQDKMAFMRFLMDVRDYGMLRPGVGPAIVHCSAGIGRSGVFTLADVCLSSIERAGSLNSLNVKDVLLDIRKQRLGLVQTSEQLRFAYLTILNAAHHVLGLGQSMDGLKKEVEDEIVAAESHNEEPLLVSVHPPPADDKKAPHTSSCHIMALAPSMCPKSSTESLSSLSSDTDSIFSLSDSTTFDKPCVPAPTSFAHRGMVEDTPKHVSISLSVLSTTSAESSDLLDHAETVATGDEAIEGPRVAVESKKSWFKRLKQKIFRRRKNM